MARTIALVDDDRNIVASVAMALQAEGFKVYTYTDGEAALDGLDRRPADLAILDIKMPRMGADDYITKPFSQRLLIERVRAVLRRHERARPEDNVDGVSEFVRRGELVLDSSRHLCTWRGEAVILTVTEFLLVKALANRPGHVKNRDQLIDAAYGEQIYVDDRTIDSHIKRLRKKFCEVDPAFAQIETLYGLGYRYRDG